MDLEMSLRFFLAGSITMERAVHWGTRFLAAFLCCVAFCTLGAISHVSAVAPNTAKPLANLEPLKKGDAAGAFYVTKVAGAEEDGVRVGTELCYRCRYGSRPMVMVFTRRTGGEIPKLMQQLDSAVVDNEASQFRALVTLMGEDAAKVKESAAQVAERSGVKHVPIVVAKETVGGPANYRLSKSADVTIVVASDSQVVSAKTYQSDRIDIAAIMGEVNTLVK
jgi:hypothetical protein